MAIRILGCVQELEFCAVLQKAAAVLSAVAGKLSLMLKLSAKAVRKSVEAPALDLCWNEDASYS